MAEHDTGDLENISSDLDFKELEDASGGLMSVRRSQSQFEITEIQKIIPSGTPRDTQNPPVSKPEE